MGQSLIDKIQAKLELFRLEQRYTRRRHRRSTFVSNAIYVDGEYVYQTPSSTGSSTDTNTSRNDALHGERPIARPVLAPSPFLQEAVEQPVITPPDRKRLNRFSSIPSFGRNFATSNGTPRIEERRASVAR